jgi:antitoxin (DNA-binding transcriptional repressor) of toxin-antitoxin stability system
MYAVGLRELKAKLSEYVQRARRGEIVLVTDRGQVVAELRSPTVHEIPDDELGALRQLEESGALRWGLPHDASAYARSPLARPAGTAQALLDGLRDETVQLVPGHDPVRRK